MPGILKVGRGGGENESINFADEGQDGLGDDVSSYIQCFNTIFRSNCLDHSSMSVIVFS